MCAPKIARGFRFVSAVIRYGILDLLPVESGLLRRSVLPFKSGRENGRLRESGKYAQNYREQEAGQHIRRLDHFIL
jgi:hypothetical protein